MTVCKVCGENDNRATSNSFSRCKICGRNQNWLGTAKQPSWWPEKLKVIDTVAHQWRWTYWAASFSVLLLLLLVTVGNLVSSTTANNDSVPVIVPYVVGMNLQEAQDCLQSHGFIFLDDEPAPGEPRFQVYDRNWTVTGQIPTGEVENKDARILLYAKNDGGNSSVICPD
jgi:hypothetical protein